MLIIINKNIPFHNNFTIYRYNLLKFNQGVLLRKINFIRKPRKGLCFPALTAKSNARPTHLEFITMWSLSWVLSAQGKVIISSGATAITRAPVTFFLFGLTSSTVFRLFTRRSLSRLIFIFQHITFGMSVQSISDSACLNYQQAAGL